MLSVLAADFAVAQSPVEAPQSGYILFDMVPDQYRAELWTGSAGDGIIDQKRIVALTGNWLAISGVYTSRQKTIVGLAIASGDLLQPYSQRWDGVLILDPQGKLRLALSDNIVIGDEKFSLKRGLQARNALIAKAAQFNLTVLQSHMLVINGANDVNPSSDDPKFVRRLIVEDGSGRIFVWQSRDALTLHQAATVLISEFDARMAFNLDMGSYDYCLRRKKEILQRCGRLGGVDKLSNILLLRDDR